MKLIERLVAPTPPFFQKIRTIGLLLTAGSFAAFKLPVLPALPAVTQLITHAAIAGMVMIGVSQAAVENERGPDTAK